MRACIFISIDNSKNRIIKIGIFDVIREIESIIEYNETGDLVYEFSNYDGLEYSNGEKYNKQYFNNLFLIILILHFDS